MKFSLLLCLVSSMAFAQSFESSSSDFDQRTSPKKELTTQEEIAESMRLNCTNGSCRIIGSTTSGEGWTFSLTGGQGNPTNTNGNNIYVGDNTVNNNQQFYGATLTYRKINCRTDMTVPDVVYKKIMAHMNALVKKDGEIPMTFLGSTNTVLMFYTSIMNKIDSGCRQNN